MSAQVLRILIIGGYGTFGGRLAQLLASEPRIELVIAGRSQAKAQTFCDALPPGTARRAAVFDRDADVGAQLTALSPHIVVDASGPFQAYGEDPYKVVRAAIARRIHYLDLADGSDFVWGVSAFDTQAKAAGVFVLSGVSSFPVLTAAVVRHLSAGMDKVDQVVGGIAPSPYAGVGRNVIRAIASYAGKPIRMRRGGAQRFGYGFGESRRYTIAPPGRLPLGSIRFSLVDVPDLTILSVMRPDADEVWMGAGPVPEILHRALNALAWLVRKGVLRSLVPLAPLFHWASNVLRWGEHRGGMFVEVTGRADGRPLKRSWHLLAEGNDGPLIPSMAVEAIVRQGLQGAWPVRGARSAHMDLQLSDYERVFAGRTISSGQREDDDPSLPLYRRVLGDAWDRLPGPVRALHDLTGTARVAGRAEVERGEGLLSRLAGRVFGFPNAGSDVPLEVDFTGDAQGETWRRNFAGQSFRSRQWAGAGRAAHLILERFGIVTVALAPVLDGDKLRLVVRRCSVLGVPIPPWLAPGGEAYETAVDGVFQFHVEIGHPLTGLIVRYRGWLKPESVKVS